MGKVLTLLYHRVNELERDINLLAVSADNFYRHMSWLKENFQIVRFEEDWSQLDGEAVCITFDDGYADNFTKALPVLKELKIPATVFMATGNIGKNCEFWWDELESDLFCRISKTELELKDDVFGCKWPAKDYQERKILYETLHWLMINNRTRMWDWLHQMENWETVSEEDRKINYLLEADEYKELYSSELTIGAHTVNHCVLSKMSVQEQEVEINESKKALEQIFGNKIEVISYPFGGRNDYTNDTIEICKRLGFHKAASNFPGIWIENMDLFEIPRNIVRNWDKEDFINKIRGFWKEA